MIQKILSDLSLAYDTLMEFSDKKPLLGAIIGVIMFRIGDLVSHSTYGQVIGIITMTLGCLTAFFMMVRAMIGAYKDVKGLREGNKKDTSEE
jgi:hypothetical protein